LEPGKIRVLYIASLGHSGSTLLDILLGQHSLLQSLGEVLFIDEWFERQNLCSCGEIIQDCPFWSSVTEGHFKPLGGIHSPDYPLRSTELFRSIQKYCGPRILVDSSKSRHRLKRLLEDPRLEVRIVHLVRNGLAVVHSLGISRARPGNREEIMTPATPIFKAVFRWWYRNRAIERLLEGLPSEDYVRIRYEDLCRYTERELSRALSLMNLSVEPNMLAPQLENTHNISGSRWRFERQGFTIKMSTRWQSETGLFRRLVFAIFAGRLNRKYGYGDEIT